MKRILFLSLILLSSCAALAQLQQMPGYGQKATRFRALDFMGLPVIDTVCNLTVNATNGDCIGAVVYRTVGGDTTMYVRNAVRWQKVGSAPDLSTYMKYSDTVYLSNRINNKLSISDTAALKSSMNLQRVMDNGNTSNKPLILDGGSGKGRIVIDPFNVAINRFHSMSTGAAAYIPINFKTGGALFSDISGSNVTHDGTSSLQVVGPMKIEGTIGSLVVTNGTTTSYFGNGGGRGYIGTTTAHDVSFYTSNNEKMRLTNSGRLLLGYTADANQLFQVNGTGLFNGVVTSLDGFQVNKTGTTIGSTHFVMSNSSGQAVYAHSLKGAPSGATDGNDYLLSVFDNTGNFLYDGYRIVHGSGLLELYGGAQIGNIPQNEYFTQANSSIFVDSLGRVSRDMYRGNRGVMYKKGILYGFGDSQTWGANGGSNPIYTNGSRLYDQFRWLNLLAAGEQGAYRSLDPVNYGVGSTSLGWLNGNPQIYSHLNMMGNLNVDWAGTVAALCGWNNLGPSTPATDTAFFEMYQRAQEATIARLLLDGYAGLTAAGYNNAGLAAANGWTTTGINSGVTVTGSDFRNVYPFYYGVAATSRFTTQLDGSEYIDFSLAGKRAIALFYETSTSGSNFDVTVNGHVVYRGNSEWTGSQDILAFPGVVWLENLPENAQIRLTNSGSGTVDFLAYGWVEKTATYLNSRQILYGTTSGNIEGRSDSIVQAAAKYIYNAVSMFSEYPVFFANAFNSWNQDTDIELVDPAHLTPVGNMHVFNAFNNAVKLPFSKSKRYVDCGILKFENYLPLIGGTMSGTITAPGEALRLFGAGPYISFFDGANAIRTGYLQANAGGQIILEGENATGILINGTNVGIGASGPTSKLDINATNGYNQLRLRTQYTPTSSVDSNGAAGDVAVDDNYIYFKTATGWKRSALSTF